MNKKSFRQNLQTNAFREMLIIGVITFILIILGLTIHWTEYVVNTLYRLQDTGLDDLFISFIVVGFLLTIYTFRRSSEKKELLKSIELTKSNLNKTSEELEILMQSSSSILFRTKIDEDFTLIDTSENVKQVLGYSREEMFKKHFWASHLHPEDSPKVFNEIPVLFETGFLFLRYIKKFTTLLSLLYYC